MATAPAEAAPPASLAFEVELESEIHGVVSAAKAYALELGFDRFEAANISLAVSEIVTNAVRYADGAQVLLRRCNNRKGLEITVADQGPGIDDLANAMRDGYTSRPQTSLGMGLGAARRAVDDINIDTSAAGTTVTLVRYLGLPREDLDSGVVSFASVDGVVNGDQYVIKPYEGEKLLLAIIDGAGQGAKANATAKLVADLIKDHYKAPLDKVVYLAHDTLLSSSLGRGAELGLVRITHDEIEYLMMGNLRLFVLSEPRKSITVHDGSLGLSLPANLTTSSFARPLHFTLVLHSDGIEGVDYLYQLSPDKSAQKIAESIFNRFALAHDDATIIVVNG